LQGGGLWATVTDYVKLLSIAINEGVGVNGKRFLKAETVRMAFQDQIAHLPGSLDRPINTYTPDTINPGPDGIAKWGNERRGWGLSFCLSFDDLPTGRKAGSGWWYVVDAQVQD
jgi:methyl acetate hydrolase